MDDLSFGDWAARTAWRLFPKRAFSSAVGFGAGIAVPAKLRRVVLERFANTYGIDLSEAEHPLEAYEGVDQLFTRRLKPGARPIDPDPRLLAAPSDGVVVQAGLADGDKLIQAKGTFFSLETLVGDPAIGRALAGGSYVITYLSPKDYHRVHAPVGDRVIGWRHVPGTLFSVNDKSVLRERELFAKNERFVTFLDGPAGLCAVAMVAAVGVGHVTASYDADVATHGRFFAEAGLRHRTYDDARPLTKGAEIGIFHLGSTSIAVFAPGRVRLRDLPAGTVVRMGETIGEIVPTDAPVERKGLL